MNNSKTKDLIKKKFNKSKPTNQNQNQNNETYNKHIRDFTKDDLDSIENLYIDKNKVSHEKNIKPDTKSHYFADGEYLVKSKYTAISMSFIKTLHDFK